MAGRTALFPPLGRDGGKPLLYLMTAGAVGDASAWAGAMRQAGQRLCRVPVAVSSLPQDLHVEVVVMGALGCWFRALLTMRGRDLTGRAAFSAP